MGAIVIVVVLVCSLLGPGEDETPDFPAGILLECMASSLCCCAVVVTFNAIVAMNGRDIAERIQQ